MNTQRSGTLFWFDLNLMDKFCLYPDLLSKIFTFILQYFLLYNFGKFSHIYFLNTSMQEEHSFELRH